MLEELAGYDEWKTTPSDIREPRVVTNCYSCQDELYENDECYYIDGEYYCECCIDNAKVTLDRLGDDEIE